MELIISQSFGRIGISTTDAFMSIESRLPAVEMQSTYPKGIMNSEPVQVEIDQTQCFNEMGLKTPDALMRGIAQKSLRQGLSAIASRVREGNFLAKIEENPNGIPEIAARKLEKNVQLTVVSMPRSSPDIEFKGGLDIRWEMGKVEVEPVLKFPDISATRPDINIYLLQKPYIDIECRGNNIDKSL
ncbi:MAG: hypothetical protein HPY66_1493 [Firmicutes bacterium]|nr:hypothetical protein [Bacillota bacterium]